MNNFKRENQQIEVDTLSNESIKADKNKDNIPDYLQRENYASILNSNKDFIKWESDVEQEIEQYIMGLRGYDFDANEDKWIPISPPILNKFGIAYIKTMLRTIVNKHSINTNLSNDKIETLILFHMEAFASTLMYRKKIYGIDLADMDSITIGFDNLVSIILSRSANDSQRQHTTNRLNLNMANNENRM